MKQGSATKASTTRSTLVVTAAIRSLLSLGTKFIPTPRALTSHQPLAEFDIFTRRCRLRAQFGNDDNSDFNPKFHTPNPGWQPNRAPHLEPWPATTRQLLPPMPTSSLILHATTSHPSSVFSFVLCAPDPTIVTRLGDKNLGLTILNTSDYYAEIMQQLNTPSYQQLPPGASPPTESIHRDLIIPLFQRAHRDNLIDKQILKFISKRITPNTALLPRFYTLPKVHKPGPLRGRPIVPSHGWITTPVSIWIDHVLQPFVQSIPTLCSSSSSVILDLRVYTQWTGIALSLQLMWYLSIPTFQLIRELPSSEDL